MRNKLRGVQSRHVIARIDPGTGDAQEVPFDEFIGGIGATFLDLADTPNTYSGQSLQVVRVNAGETALEFATLSVSTSFLALTDTPNSYTGQAGLVVTVNGAETGLEFTAGGGSSGLTHPQVMSRIFIGAC